MIVIKYGLCCAYGFKTDVGVLVFVGGGGGGVVGVLVGCGGFVVLVGGIIIGRYRVEVAVSVGVTVQVMVGVSVTVVGEGVWVRVWVRVAVWDTVDVAVTVMVKLGVSDAGIVHTAVGVFLAASMDDRKEKSSDLILFQSRTRAITAMIPAIGNQIHFGSTTFFKERVRSKRT